MYPSTCVPGQTREGLFVLEAVYVHMNVCPVHEHVNSMWGKGGYGLFSPAQINPKQMENKTRRDVLSTLHHLDHILPKNKPSLNSFSHPNQTCLVNRSVIDLFVSWTNAIRLGSIAERVPRI